VPNLLSTPWLSLILWSGWKSLAANRATSNFCLNVKSLPMRWSERKKPVNLCDWWVPGLSDELGVSSVIADGLFGLFSPDETAAYFLLEVDRGSMQVVRTNFDGTSFNRKLLVYWGAWKRKLHVEQIWYQPNPSSDDYR
jgi:hypothetical protein